MNETTSWNELLRRSDWEGRQQRYAEALKLAREALDWAKREFGDKSYEVAATWEYVAKAASFNQDENTVKAAQSAVGRLIDELSKHAAGETSPLSAAALVYQANLMFMQTGNDAYAHQAFAKALHILETTQGPEHKAAGYVLARIGQFYDLSGDPQKAIPYLERAKVVFEKALGPDHVDLADLLTDLGGAYQHAAVSRGTAERQAFYENSLSALSRARRIREKIGNTDEYLYYLLQSEAAALRSLNRQKEAEVLESRANKTLPAE